MSLPTGGAWEIEVGGDERNGGFFSPLSGGVDYSQQTAPVLNLSDLVCAAGSTTVTSATGGFTSAMVGNGLQFSNERIGNFLNNGSFETQGTPNAAHFTSATPQLATTTDPGAWFNTSKALTVAAWVRFTALPKTGNSTNATVFCRNGCFQVYVDATSGYFRVYLPGVGYITLGTVTPTVGVWYHVAITFGSNGAGAYRARFYVNGAQVGADQAVATAPTFSSSPITFGGFDSVSYLNGDLTDCRLYNAELSATQVTALYTNQPSYTYDAANTNLIGWWLFDGETTAKTLIDQKGTYPLTATNGPLTSATGVNPFALSWTVNAYSTTAIVRDTVNQYDGAACLRFDSSASGGSSGLIIPAGLVSGRAYSYSFYQKASNADSSGIQIQSASSTITTQNLTTTWTLVTGTFISTSSNLALKWSGSTTNLSVFIDSLALTEVQVVINPTTLNGGFETSGSPFANWSTSAGGTSTVTRDTTTFNSGTASAKFVIDSAGDNASISQGSVLVVGRTYYLSFYAKADASGATILVTNTANFNTYLNTGVATTWTQYTVSFTATTNNGFNLFVLGSNRTVNIDDVTLIDTVGVPVQVRQITAYTNANTVTVDQAPSAMATSAINLTGRVGGALASPARAINFASNGQNAWIKYGGATPGGDYVTTTATSSVAGGTINPGTSTPRAAIVIEGYENTRGDLGRKPRIRLSANLGSGLSIFTTSQSGGNGFYLLTLRNLILDGGSNTNSTGLNGGSICRAEYCEAYNCTVGFAGNGLRTEYCYASLCNAGFSVGDGFRCTAYACTKGGFVYTILGGDAILGSLTTAVGSGRLRECLYVGTQNGEYGFYQTPNGNAYPFHILESCVSYKAGLDGFKFGQVNVKSVQARDCIATLSLGYGFNGGCLRNCSIYGNTSSTTATTGTSAVALTADPFNNAAGGDYSLNNVAGGGALIRQGGLAVTRFTASSNQYASVADDGSWLANGFTWGGWVRFNSLGTSGLKVFAAKQQVAYFYRNSSGNVVLQPTTGTSDYPSPPSSASPVANGVWIYVAYTFASNGAGAYRGRFYLNGAQIGSDMTLAIPTSLAYSLFFANFNTGSFNLDCDLSDWRLFSNEQTAAQILALYNAGPTAVPDTTALYHWPFEQDPTREYKGQRPLTINNGPLTPVSYQSGTPFTLPGLPNTISRPDIGATQGGSVTTADQAAIVSSVTQKINPNLLASGTVGAGSTVSSIILAGTTFTTTDEILGTELTVGNETRAVTNYNTTTKVATPDAQFNVTPVTGGAWRLQTARAVALDFAQRPKGLGGFVAPQGVPPIQNVKVGVNGSVVFFWQTSYALAITGQTVAGLNLARRNGTSFTSAGLSVTELGLGYYLLNIPAADLTVPGIYVYGFYSASANAQVVVNVGYFDPTANNLGAVALPTIASGTNGSLPVTDGSGNVASNLKAILGTNLVETTIGWIAGAFRKFFNIATPTLTTGGTDQSGDAYAAVGNLSNLSSYLNIFAPGTLVRQTSTAQAYQFVAQLKDLDGHQVNFDSAPTLSVANATGTDRSANVSAVTNPSTGEYRWTYTVATSAADEEIVFKLSGLVGGNARVAYATPVVADADSLAALAAIQAQTDKIGTNSADSPNSTTANTTIAAIKPQTDKIPANPAVAGEAATAATSINAHTDSAVSGLASQTTANAIKTQTDKIPSSPAVAGEAATAATAINNHTDSAVAGLATQTSVNALGAPLQASKEQEILTAIANATGTTPEQLVDVEIENGYSMRAVLRFLAAMNVGTDGIDPDGTVYWTGLDGVTRRVEGKVDGLGQRVGIVLNGD